MADRPAKYAVNGPRSLGKGVGIACVILGVLYWGNLWTARKYWQPRKAELEAIADSLKTS